jgi:hypothetical protein
MKVVPRLLLICLILFAVSCYPVRYDGPYKGRVVDADTGLPIQGVVVLGEWSKGMMTPAGTVHSYYDVAETVTDKNGDFEIRGLGLKILTTVEPMNVLIFKSGYEYIGLGPWESFKITDYPVRKIVWQGDRAIIPLKKLTLEERKERSSPSPPSSNAPFEKVRMMLLELAKDDFERGMPTIEVWQGKKIE